MKIATMLNDTLRSLVRHPVTEQIPSAPPCQLRGRLQWTAQGCTGCALCAKDCPADALELIRLEDKHFVIRYNVDRCTFCGQCVENCRFDCLTMAGEDWSLAAATRAGFTTYFGEDADVERVVAGRAANGNQPVAEGKGRGRRNRE